jgi:hypothetical protein
MEGKSKRGTEERDGENWEGKGRRSRERVGGRDNKGMRGKSKGRGRVEGKGDKGGGRAYSDNVFRRMDSGVLGGQQGFTPQMKFGNNNPTVEFSAVNKIAH